MCIISLVEVENKPNKQTDHHTTQHKDKRIQHTTKPKEPRTEQADDRRSQGQPTKPPPPSTGEQGKLSRADEALEPKLLINHGQGRR
jgi:hypothetical protein